jgi:hypothetical protein
MPTQREKIVNKTKEVLEQSQDGVKYFELVTKVKEKLPEIELDRVKWEVWWWLSRDESVARPERGLYILKKYLGERIDRKPKPVDQQVSVTDEALFYKPFADYLVSDLGECTKAIPLGGSRFEDRWGTPDVIGVYKFSETDPVRPPIEIVSAEIKIDSNQLITAFGQACAYKLFSHKVYLVIPNEAAKDVSRVESLCLKFGLGLILFNKTNPEKPNFEIRARAVKSEPDYFYVNEYLKRLGEDLKNLS